MSAANGSAMPQEASEIADKGKGKAVGQPQTHDIGMDDDEESSDEESGVEEDHADDVEEEEDDDNGEIDLDNIIPDGRRTRGKQINWAEADQKSREAGDGVEEDDEDDDEDFEDHEGAEKMEE